MNSRGDNVADFRARQVPGGGGGSGEKTDSDRLVAVELDVREIKTDMKHVALKTDVLGLKIWVLVGVVVGMITAISFGIAIARLFLTSTGTTD